MSGSPYQVMPPLSEADYEALKADIAERGVLIPIEVDEDGNVLDGHHRLRIAEELGLPCPKFVREGMTEREKRTHARQLNIARRHLNQKQKRQLIEGELREAPERSNRQIAEGLGVSDNTVRSVRSGLEATAQIAQLDKTTGKDGKARTTRRRPAKTETRLRAYRQVLGIKGKPLHATADRVVRLTSLCQQIGSFGDLDDVVRWDGSEPMGQQLREEARAAYARLGEFLTICTASDAAVGDETGGTSESDAAQAARSG